MRLIPPRAATPTLRFFPPGGTRAFSARSYAAAGARPPSRSSRLGAGPPLSLEHFLQRSRVLSLYRDILRGTRRVEDQTTRDETRRFARTEFERHRDVTDLSKIRYLLSVGKTEWQGMERYIGGF